MHPMPWDQRRLEAITNLLCPGIKPRLVDRLFDGTDIPCEPVHYSHVLHYISEWVTAASCIILYVCERLKATELFCCSEILSVG